MHTKTRVCITISRWWLVHRARTVPSTLFGNRSDQGAASASLEGATALGFDALLDTILFTVMPWCMVLSLYDRGYPCTTELVKKRQDCSANH